MLEWIHRHHEMIEVTRVIWIPDINHSKHLPLHFPWILAWLWKTDLFNSYT
jgi:hypothetical protein